MENINKISVVLPIKSSSAFEFEDFFEKSIKSVQFQNEHVDELVIVYCDETSLENYLNSYDFGNLNVKLVKWAETPNFQSQVNKGVSESSSNWVSVLEFDDEYSNIWFKNVKKYMGHYKDVECFLPIVVDVDDKSVFAGFTNEATFAANISSEIGTLTNETLQTFQNFQFSGCVFKKEMFENFGGLKSNFRLTFNYEFFLRITHNSVKVMSIPKVGYKHINLRVGSIFWNYKNGENKINEDEARFWIETAKKESFFNVERDINYEPENV
jgi:hypothetical protein